MLRIPIIVGSVRRGRQSIKVARFVKDRLEAAGMSVPLLDLKDLDLPIMEERLAFRDDPPPSLLHFSATVATADAVVVVSPEYNGSIPGVLKNALDYLHGEWARKPVGLVTVSGGGFGGAQVQTQLQLLFLRLRALPVATFAVSHVGKSFAEDGTPAEAHYETSMARMIDSLRWYAEAIGAAADR